jgi:dienelactone hydrolase
MEKYLKEHFDPRVSLLALSFCFLAFSVYGQSEAPFASTPLKEKGDLSSLMVEGIDRFLIREIDRTAQNRPGLWRRNFSTPEAFKKSIAAQRELLASRLGVVDERVAPDPEVLMNDQFEQLSVESRGSVIRAVRWKVLEGLSAEGLLLQPKGKVVARVVMIPDADVVPEVLAGIQKAGVPGYAAARRLAEAGCEVVIPVLVSRADTFSGSDQIGRFTNQPHREWIYRQAYVLGRHVIGYELQKIFSAIDWLESRNKAEGSRVPVGVAGHGEGGLLALYAAALDVRISSTLVSGYFNAREHVWEEPIYRNVFGLLKHFGDAEVAVMAWPRPVIIEHAKGPEVSGPPKPTKGRAGAAPGSLTTPDLSSAKAEWNRAKALLPENKIHLQWYANENSAFEAPFSPAALGGFAHSLKVNLPSKFSSLAQLKVVDEWPEATARQERTVRQMERRVQEVLATCELTREQNFWQTLKGDEEAQEVVKARHRKRFADVIGALPAPSMPANARARLLEQSEKWTSYEITLDVWPEVFAWGILLIPNDLKPGEERPAVVCQHGLEGLPMDVVTTDPDARAFQYYKGFAARLAERGYVTFAPHNPYRGEDRFRVLQRKANPLGLSLFSIITGQHQRIVEWLGQQSFVDAGRIGFYGLSYGGKTAMRIPVLVEGYTLSICSGDFNEWVRKVGSTGPEAFNSYPFTKEYEIPEWDLGHTFNYAEMAALIAPRPFMVERGHSDGVGTDEWVAYEFAKVRRHYDALGLSGSCKIEYFNGPHTIHANGTFEFLDFHLRKR